MATNRRKKMASPRPVAWTAEYEQKVRELNEEVRRREQKAGLPSVREQDD